VPGGSAIFEVSPTTAANTAANPFFTNVTDGTNALGTFANYGTAPGAVKALGVNAYITNAPAVTGSDLNDSNNSSTATLGANAVFTGTGTQTTGYAQLTVAVDTDQISASSATTGMVIQW